MSEKEDKEGHPTQQLTRQRAGNHNHTDWPLPLPLPRREGRDYRDTPIGLPLVAYGAICGCIIRCSAHFISLFVYIESTVKYVHSVILCLSVIMFITINTQLNMFFLSCFVFMSFCLSSCSHQGEEEFVISII